jgi:prepilin-type N-terminal cleavage/methylation domain-containing protein
MEPSLDLSGACGQSRVETRRRPALRGRGAGYTLIESAVALALLGLVLTATFAAILYLNRQAGLARLQSAATHAASLQVDRILTEAPFNPDYATPRVPAVLATGTASAPVLLFSGSATGVADVTGTLTTVVSDATTTGTIDGVQRTLHARTAQVRVDYAYGGRPYRVELSTYRASD